MMRKIIFALLLLPSLASAQTTLTATTCNLADVSTAVGLANNGDTVNIPAGDCTWSAQLTVTKGITLKGAGQGTTTLRDNVLKDGSSNSSLMLFNVSAPFNFSISDFTLVGQALDANGWNKGHIALFGTSQAFHVHHITMNSPQSSFVRADGYLWGLLDHLTINGATSFLQCGHSNWGGANYGDGSWAEVLYLGTNKAIYVEDSTIVANGDPFTTNAADGMDGCRMVFRYNTLVQSNTTSHGTDSSQYRRGIRSVEIYNNTYTFPSSMAPDFIHWFRGGTGVMYNNTVTAPGGLNHIAKHSNLRDSASYTPWGQCNGTAVYDGNTAGQNGWICVDQPGAGTSDLIGRTGTDPVSAKVNNTADPIYVWNNTLNGSSNNCANFSCLDDINVKVGRDIIFGTARPGYTAYTYPHPLQSGGIPPAASATITSPATGTIQAPGSTFTVTGTSSAGTGSVTQVDVYIGATLSCSDTVAPFSPWTCTVTAPTNPGSYNLTAKATDGAGVGGSSNTVVFTVPIVGGDTTKWRLR